INENRFFRYTSYYELHITHKDPDTPTIVLHFTDGSKTVATIQQLLDKKYTKIQLRIQTDIKQLIIEIDDEKKEYEWRKLLQGDAESRKLSIVVSCSLCHTKVYTVLGADPYLPETALSKEELNNMLTNCRLTLQAQKEK
ncbi:unnamed protein product, partial [Didymodactylos carnosus]